MLARVLAALEVCDDFETLERPAAGRPRIERVSVRTAADRSVPAATAGTQLALNRELQVATRPRWPRRSPGRARGQASSVNR